MTCENIAITFVFQNLRRFVFFSLKFRRPSKGCWRDLPFSRNHSPQPADD